MTYTDTFVGRLRNPKFDWSDERQTLDENDIELLTESFLDRGTYSAVQRSIRGKTPFRKLDWGSWAIPATKDTILGIIEHWKVGWDLPNPGDKTHKPRLQRARCKTTIAALPADQIYVLVIEEF